MPLIYSFSENYNTKVMVWQQTESLSFFLEKIELDNSDTNILDGPNQQRQINGIVLKFLIQQLVGSAIPIKYKKDEYGKPYLINDTRYISVSHSKNVVAAIISDMPCGIDIQFSSDKTARIASKFINQNEFDYINENKLDYYHIIWGAKEALYKSDGKRGLDFKRNLIISPFNININGSIVGEIKRENSSFFKIKYRQINLDEPYYLVYSIENK